MCRAGGRRCPSSSNQYATLMRQRKRLSKELESADLSHSRRQVLIGRYGANQKRLMAYYKEHPVIEMPAENYKTITGDTGYAVAFRIGKTFDLAKTSPALHIETAHHLGVRLREGEAYEAEPFIGSVNTKPVGGVWASPYTYDGRTEWLNHEAGFGDGQPAHTYNVVAKEGTRELHLRTWEDYTLLCDLGRKTIRGHDWMDGVKDLKTIDYERLGVDVIVLHDELVMGHEGRYGRGSGYETLNGWDLETYMILNPDSFEYEDVSDTIPELSLEDRWDYDEDNDPEGLPAWLTPATEEEFN